MAAEHVERIGNRIRERREELGLSRDDLAREMPGKTNGNAIYRWEKGLHEARPDALEALATALDVPVSYFYVDQPDKSETPDLGAALNGNGPTPSEDLLRIRDQLDRIETTVNRLQEFIETPELSSAVDAVVAALAEQPEEDGPAEASTG